MGDPAGRENARPGRINAPKMRATICDQRRAGRHETGIVGMVGGESQDMTVLARNSLPVPLRSLPQSPEWIGA